VGKSIPVALVACLAALSDGPPASAASNSDPAAGCAGASWMDRHRSPDERATLLLAQMTLDEKVQEMQANVWSTPDGTYGISIGTSSADLPLTANVRVAGGRLER
jgi:hypothetical protein